MTEGVQTHLTGPGYCGLTGQVFFERSPGDDCPLCSSPLETLPDVEEPVAERWVA